MIEAYVTYYNEEHIHSSLDYQTPSEKPQRLPPALQLEIVSL